VARGTAEIMRRSGKAKPVVWRWQARFMEKGVDGLRDKTRKPGKPTLPGATVQKAIDFVTGPPPGETGRMLAKAVGISLRSRTTPPRGPPARAAPYQDIQSTLPPTSRPLGRREEPHPGSRSRPAGTPMKPGRA